MSCIVYICNICNNFPNKILCVTNLALTCCKVWAKLSCSIELNFHFSLRDFCFYYWSLSRLLSYTGRISSGMIPGWKSAIDFRRQLTRGYFHQSLVTENPMCGRATVVKRTGVKKCLNRETSAGHWWSIVTLIQYSMIFIMAIHDYWSSYSIRSVSDK